MAAALTAKAPAAVAPVHPGAIVLARHGEPALSRKVKLNAEEYRAFWAKYEVLGLLPGQSPPVRLKSFVERAGALVASTRLRSVESAQVVGGGRTFTQDAMLIEAPLPPPNLPAWIRLSPPIWGFLARVWWWFFDHHEGQESRSEAELRAGVAADMLIGLAASGDDVVALAHGFFNFMVGRALRRRGWRLAHREGWKYWSMRRYVRVR